MQQRRLIFALKGSPHYVCGSSLLTEDLMRISPATQALTLEGSEVDDEVFLAMPRLLSLRCLDLDSSKITDQSLDAVARLPALEELWLECTKITDVGLAKLHSIKTLKFISLAYTATTKYGIDALAAAIPGIEVSL